MKILKIFGFVVGIHVFALVLIFANPGCSSTTKTAPRPGETAVRPAPAPAGSTQGSAPGIYSSASETSPLSPASGGFNPDAPALSVPGVNSGSRSSPTRPNSPVAAPLTAEPVKDVTPATTYTVKSGDSLSAIAQRNKISVAHLTAANGIAANAVLRPGQKLIIPSRPAASNGAAAPSAGAAATKTGNGNGPLAATTGPRSSEGIKHIVRAGETLGSIAKQYGVRQGAIAEANNIPDPAKIKLGAELIIPGWTPAAKNGKSKSNGPASNAPAASPAAATPTFPEQPVTAPATEPAPATPPPVPVIRLDDAPLSPATKN